MSEMPEIEAVSEEAVGSAPLAEQLRQLQAALDPKRAAAVQIARYVAAKVGLSLDERAELADAVTPVVGAALQHEQLAAALHELQPPELQLLPLLEHVLARADGWHAAACGCSGGHDDEQMGQARAVVMAWRRSRAETA